MRDGVLKIVFEVPFTGDRTMRVFSGIRRKKLVRYSYEKKKSEKEFHNENKMKTSSYNKIFTILWIEILTHILIKMHSFIHDATLLF